MHYDYLFFVAIILMSTKVLGLATKRINLPQVVGALMAGLILGPACLGLVEKTEFISSLSEIGVIVLMFSAGLETDIGELKKCGKASFIIAVIGVIVPLLGGFAVSALFNTGENTLTTSKFLQNIFIGIILTATSVSITVETLKELGKLSTRAGNAILGAALIDDILGIVALTVVTSLANPEVEIATVLLKILGFFVFAALFGVLFHILFVRWTDRTTEKLHRYNVMSFAFCLLFAYIAEAFFGVADITGAFLAGILISTSTKNKYISSRIETLSYMLLSPVFFASIGLNVTLPKMGASIVAFAGLLLVVAVLTKIIGCGLGAKICGYSTKESLQVGIGMVSRGEVALIVANKGAAVGLMSANFFGPIVIMVVITTIITPILLKIVFAEKESSKLPVAKEA
ncbi:MAG: cation:proton antiporter [Oscillospiraceae bacterium]|nr:cation:proton antiporter [Oscillospiraceae bacterium]